MEINRLIDGTSIIVLYYFTQSQHVGDTFPPIYQKEFIPNHINDQV